jgi:hypothetical protein
MEQEVNLNGRVHTALLLTSHEIPPREEMQKTRLSAPTNRKVKWVCCQHGMKYAQVADGDHPQVWETAAEMYNN